MRRQPARRGCRRARRWRPAPDRDELASHRDRLSTGARSAAGQSRRPCAEGDGWRLMAPRAARGRRLTGCKPNCSSRKPRMSVRIHSSCFRSGSGTPERRPCLAPQRSQPRRLVAGGQEGVERLLGEAGRGLRSAASDWKSRFGWMVIVHGMRRRKRRAKPQATCRTRSSSDG